MTSPISTSRTETTVSQAVEEAVRQVLPATTVESTAPIEHGNRSETVLVERAGQPSVVVQRTSDPETAHTEAALLTAIANRTTVPVPSVLGCETVEGSGVLVTEYIDGTNLHEAFVTLAASEQRSMTRAFGRHLADLHSAFSFDGCGQITATDGELSAADRAPSEWRHAYGEAAFDRLPEPFADLVGPLRELVDSDPLDDTDTHVTLFPWDFRPGNALVRDGELAAVLDWEEPLAAPAAVSVAKASYLVADWYVEESQPLREAFRAGYESVRPFPTLSSTDRAVAIADTTVDSRGVVTNPRYPELDPEASVSVHREALQSVLDIV